VVDGVGEVGQRVGQRAVEVEKDCVHGAALYNNRLDVGERSL
jgi:hypothetical protein